MTQYTREQVLKQLERVCEQADEALDNKDMKTYRLLSEVRTGLRVAVGKIDKNQDPGGIHIDDDILQPENTIKEIYHEDVNDLGQD